MPINKLILLFICASTVLSCTSKTEPEEVSSIGSATTGQVSGIEDYHPVITGSVGITVETSKDIKFGVLYSQKENIVYGVAKEAIASAKDENGAFTLEMPQLELNTKYYYCTYLKIGADVVYGKTETFTTAGISEGDAIDLGLGILWASRNLGATLPSDSGNFYSWGETTPKEYFFWDSYKHCNGAGDKLTKYTPTDGKTTLEKEDDAASVILGGKWRMPTSAEVLTIWRGGKCRWIQAYLNGVDGFVVLAENGNSIFLPNAGSWNGYAMLYPGMQGLYWTSSINETTPTFAYALIFDTGNIYRYFTARYMGQSIRPVLEK